MECAKCWGNHRESQCSPSANKLHLVLAMSVPAKKKIKVVSCKYYIPELGKTERVWPSHYLQVATKSIFSIGT